MLLIIKLATIERLNKQYDENNQIVLQIGFLDRRQHAEWIFMYLKNIYITKSYIKGL